MSTQTFAQVNRQHQAWCRLLFASLVDGGVWGVPRSGLMFRREGDKLVLTDSDGLTPDQEQDFDCIREHFADAGITVER